MDDLGITMLLQLILPKELTEYFEVRGYREEGRKIELMLEEKNVVPEGYKKEDLLSKGFYDPVIIQDFPLRDRPLYLNIKRRRWLEKSTNNVIFRDWNTVAQGTKLTKEFADFLKELFRQTTDK